MFGKLRKNFNLANILVKVFFVLAVVFSTWQTSLGTLYYAFVGNLASGIMDGFSGAAKLTIALLTSAVLGVILMLVTPLVTNLFLNVSKIYNVPRAEYCLIVNFFCTVGFFLNGLLNLINLITPVFMVWGGVIFPFIITLGCFVSFYVTTSKLYFNDVTKAHYFKCLLIAALVVLVLEVL